jgi:hypothetical protein
VQSKNPRLQLLGSGGFSPRFPNIPPAFFEMTLTTTNPIFSRARARALKKDTKPFAANSLEGEKCISAFDCERLNAELLLVNELRESALTFLRGQFEST